MRPLLIATTNSGKFKEFEALLASKFICEPLPKEIPTVVEDGKNYFENAFKKAEGYFLRLGKPVLADDSGIEVDALEGLPGLDSANYGGANLSWPERWDYLYKNLNASRNKSRAARFRCVLCYYDGKNPPQYFEATTEGNIAQESEGAGGFGYDPIFWSQELGKTLGEATPEEKALVSHRARATQKFLDWLTTHKDS